MAQKSGWGWDGRRPEQGAGNPGSTGVSVQKEGHRGTVRGGTRSGLRPVGGEPKCTHFKLEQLQPWDLAQEPRFKTSAEGSGSLFRSHALHFQRGRKSLSADATELWVEMAQTNPLMSVALPCLNTASQDGFSLTSWGCRVLGGVPCLPTVWFCDS